jgi:hypothetical protein
MKSTKTLLLILVLAAPMPAIAGPKVSRETVATQTITKPADIDGQPLIILLTAITFLTAMTR